MWANGNNVVKQRLAHSFHSTENAFLPGPNGFANRIHCAGRQLLREGH